MEKRILITGAAGFIGSALAARLAADGAAVLGVDALTDYYDVRLKMERLRRSGIEVSDAGCPVEGARRIASVTLPGLSFICADILDARRIADIIRDFGPEYVVNLAAVPGVRNSYLEPQPTFSANVIGFFNVLEAMRLSECRNLIYASSSAVYGNSLSLPFREENGREQAASVYAATKMCDESLAEAYANSFGFCTIGLRMFSVYGPWGRPDMAPMLFADALASGEKIKLYDRGRATRDFTYIDDVIESIVRIISLPAVPGSDDIYNIGPGRPVPMAEFLQMLAGVMGLEPLAEYGEAFPGEAKHTFADSSKLQAVTGYRPSTTLEEGLGKFVAWHTEYRLQGRT